MLKRILVLPLAALLFGAQALASQIESPKLTPVPSTEQQTRLIKEGIALHDKGDFDGAIRKYDEALAENPHNVFAIYEMSFAYFLKKDYRKSLEVGMRGAQYKSDMLHRFYVTVGNSLDQLGEPKKAVEVYKSGLKLAPAEAMLHYNLAITYLNLKKPDEAKKSLKAAAASDPKHASSHLALAAHFYNTGYRTPSLFAAARFLTLEPQTARSDVALRLMREVLGGGVTAGKNPNEINISINMNPKKDEGDFDSIEMMLGLSKAVGSLEESKGKSEIRLLVEQVDSLLAVVSENEDAKKGTSFVYKYYVPYFVEMKQKGLVEPFVYYTHQRSNIPGVREWVETHSGRVLQFLTWSKNYRWPAEIPK